MRIAVRGTKWRRVGLHGWMECPVCGAVVADWKGRQLHEGWHGGDIPDNPDWEGTNNDVGESDGQ